jgi:hypothetical protein
MPKFCVKKLNVDFRKISDDVYSVRDLSEYDFNDIQDVLTSAIEIKIKTPGDEEFSLLMPGGGATQFSLKNKKLFAMEDGQYCVTTESCGGPVKKLVGYYPNIKEKIDGLILTTKDKQYIKLIFEQYKIMQVLDEYDNKKDAGRIYQDITDMLEKCMAGQHCYR